MLDFSFLNKIIDNLRKSLDDNNTSFLLCKNDVCQAGSCNIAFPPDVFSNSNKENTPNMIAAGVVDYIENKNVKKIYFYSSFLHKPNAVIIGKKDIQFTLLRLTSLFEPPCKYYDFIFEFQYV